MENHYGGLTVGERVARTNVEYMGRKLDVGAVVQIDETQDAPFVHGGIFTKREDTAVKRYPCRVCGESYTSASARDAHGKRRHG